MLRILKPFAGPAITFLVGAGISLSNMKSAWLSGLLIGFALTWGVGVLLSHRALLRRFPGLLEWFPFLDPTGGFATAAELTSSYVKGRQFKIALIVEGNEIRDRTFEDCVIHGPAVLMFSDYADARDCVFTVEPERMNWVLDFEKHKTLVDKMPSGGLIVRKCIFRRCTFVNIGFVSDREAAEEFKRMFERKHITTEDHGSLTDDPSRQPPSPE